MEENTINLYDLFKLFWLRKAYIILIAVLFAAFGALYTFFLVVPDYKASATLLLAQAASPDAATDAQGITLTDLNRNKSLVNNYTAIIKSRAVLKKVIEQANVDISTTELADKLSVAAVTNTEVINLSVTDRDPEKAALMANTFADVFMEKVVEIYKLDVLHLVDDAEVPAIPYNVNHTRDIALFTFAGLFIAVAGLFLLFYFDTTIKNPQNKAQGAAGKAPEMLRHYPRRPPGYARHRQHRSKNRWRGHE